MLNEDEAAAVDNVVHARKKAKASDDGVANSDAKKHRKPSISAVLKYARREVWENFFNVKAVEALCSSAPQLPSSFQTDGYAIYLNIAKTIRYDKKRKKEKKKAWSAFYAEIKNFHSAARALLKLKKMKRKNEGRSGKKKTSRKNRCCHDSRRRFVESSYGP